MTELFTVGFNSEEQIAKWLDGDDFLYGIIYNKAMEDHFENLDDKVSKFIGKLLQELGEDSWYIFKGREYVGKINSRLTEMIK